MSSLLLWSLRASAVVAIGFALMLTLRHRSASTRNLVLRIALVAVWLVPLAAFVAPRIEVPLPTPTLAPSAAPPIVEKAISEPMPIQEGWSVVQSDPHDVSTLGFKRQTALSSAWVPAVGPFFLLWSGGTGLLVLRWIVGLRRLRRLRREATPTEDPDVWRTAIAVPATYGRTILMPLASKEWPEARIRAAILHERAHVRRKDWHWQTLAGLFVALHWLNPLAWTLARALRDTAEAAADDEALALMRPSDYARELLAVAASVGPAGPALAMARRGGVKHRVVAILANRERHRPSARAIAVASGLVGSFALVTASVTRGLPRLTLVEPSGTLIAKGSVATLPNGTTVEIQSIQSLTPIRIDVWTPGGRSAGPPTLDHEYLVPRQRSNHEFAFRFRVKPSHSEHQGFTIRLPEAFDSSFLNIPSLQGRDGYPLVSYGSLSSDAQSTTLLLGVASGPFNLERRSVTPQMIAEVTDDHSLPLELNVPHQEAVKWDAASFHNDEIWLSAVTSLNRRIEPQGFASGDWSGGFSLKPNETIREICIRHRPYRWIAFHDISLVPKEDAKKLGGKPIFKTHEYRDRSGAPSHVSYELVGIQR